MRGPSPSRIGESLRVLRAQALASGVRVFSLVQVEGVPVESPVVRGEYRTIADALSAARRFGVSSCVVREWATLPGGVRVHVNSTEWLLEWHCVAVLRRSAETGGADSTRRA